MNRSSEHRQALKCIACEHDSAEAFVTVPRVPVLCNVLWSDESAAKNVRRVDITLAYCTNCGHVFNPDFDPDLMDYTETYENSLHFSPHFHAYAHGFAEELVRRHDLYGKDIVEIGSGKGEFLDMLCRFGDNRGVGFDPSYVPSRAEYAATTQISFVSDFYSEKYAGYAADFICCRHTLEHIPEPAAFLRMLRRIIGKRTQVRVFFEVPNALFTLRDMAVWDIIYEHCSYFTPYSLAHLFTASGFQVTDVRETYDGQFIALEAVPVESGAADMPFKCAELEQIQDLVTQFAARYRHKTAEEERLLAALDDAGKDVVIWGAGSKGITFLNVLASGHGIRYAVDINPHKHGKYITGTGQQIVDPAHLRAIAPDTIIVMNPVYMDEIKDIVHALELTPEFITV